MPGELMAYILSDRQCTNLDVSARREWLLTNGIGGFAMGTAAGINTRRYHGLLVAADPAPAHRTVLLAAVDASIQGSGGVIGISTNQYPEALYPEGYQRLVRFSVGEIAHWRYAAEGLQVDKKLRMHEGENAVTLSYRNTGSKPFLLTLNPLVCHKFYHGNFTAHEGYPEKLTFPKDAISVEAGGLKLVLYHPGAQRIPVQGWYYRFEHAREVERGLDPRDDLYCPGELRYELLPGESAVLVASTRTGIKPLEIPEQDEAYDFRLGNQLREAGKPFLIRCKERTTIMAGYPWFTDWGRDTFISLPGICLHRGEIKAARDILDAFASQMRQGLIPNRFVEAGEEPQYNTVDGTLWFVYALHRTLEAEWNEDFAKRLFPVLQEIFRWHMKGALYGIKVDPTDGLLTQGVPGTQLTWMDAKIGDWVVTPRHGKPVEINGLWVNALRVMEWLAGKLGLDGAEFAKAAEKAEKNFDRKFWHEGLGHYLDTVDPDDGSLRPNQVIAMSLPFGPATGDHARRALEVVGRQLLTPMGLRTLGPNEPGYRGKYVGQMRDLDAAYHQGTVWPWLIGPFVSALVRHDDGLASAKRMLKEVKDMLTAYGLGGIAEVYDGDGPQQPNGCPWQAWNVAEALRAWVEIAGGD
jgi:predicted glycogen debranching enzyme